MLKYIKKGYYVLEFFICVENRDNMPKDLSLIFLFFVLFGMIIFFIWDINPIFPFETGNVLFRNVLNRDTLCINIQNWNILREEKFREKLYQRYFD
jgi:hypothetical protein